jgi:hypothetical protein
MTAGRVMMLAYYFPPLTGVASDRAVSLASGLSDLGWEPVVITAVNGFYHRTAESSAHPFAVIRTRSAELSRAVRGAYAGATAATSSGSSLTVAPVQAGRVGETLRRLVREWLYMPDAQIGWFPFAVRAAQHRLAADGGASVVLSTSVPFTSHLAAMRIARRRGLPWIAEFRDPWSTARWPDRTESAARRRVNLAIERRIVDAADHILVTSQSTLAEFISTHPTLGADRISVITNGFTPLPTAQQPGPSEPMELVYAGGVTAGEDLEPLIRALDRVYSDDPEAFTLKVLGPAEPWTRFASGSDDRPWLELEGVVSPARAREAVVRGSALLLVQRNPAYDTTLPGKAFEYIGSRRPIIAIISPDREVATMLRARSDVRLVAPGAIDSVGAEVERLIAEHRAGTLQGPRVPREVVAPLERSEQARQLAEILGRVAAKRRNGESV